MPLSSPAPRREVHDRAISMKVYAREDGLFDVEARVVDLKTFDFALRGGVRSVPAGTAIHDLCVRVTVDRHYVVQAIEASSDVTPHAICRETETSLQVMVGERIAAGWSSKVKEKLRGAASCTHLMELLIPLASAALQGISALDPKQRDGMDDKAIARKVDSCHAYARHSKVVRRLWPSHYEPPPAGDPSGA